MSRISLAALLILAGALLAASTSGAEDRRTVAVLPVVVHASGEQEYLQSGVSDMLASRLGRSPGVAVIRVGDASAATNDPEKAKEAGRAVGADYVLFGSFTRFGDGASLDIRCSGTAEGDAAPRSVFIQSGQISDLIPKIDALAEKIGVYVAAGAPSGLPAVAAAPGGASSAELAGLRRQLEEVLGRLDDLEARVAADGSE